MGKQRHQQTATGQAALLFIVAGCLGMVTELFLDTGSSMRVASLVLNAGAILSGVTIALAPWDRWSPRASLVVVPLAFALLAIGQRVAPGAPSSYGVWFVVVFAWIGFWHPPHTGLWFAPLGAAAYVAPFIGVPWTRPTRSPRWRSPSPPRSSWARWWPPRWRRSTARRMTSSRPEPSSSAPTSPTT